MGIRLTQLLTRLKVEAELGNSGPLTSLPVDRLNGPVYNADTRANSIFDPSIPSMRKCRYGEWWYGKKINGENIGPLTSLPVDRLTATDGNADHSCQFIRISLYAIFHHQSSPL